MFRRPPGRQQAADDPRGPQRPRKTNMEPTARVRLAREVAAFSGDFEARLPKRASVDDVRAALAATDSEYQGWSDEVKSLMGAHPEPTADLCLGILKGKLAPEIANLFFGARMCSQLEAMLIIADKLDTAPRSWSVDDKRTWLSSVPYVTAVELDRLDESNEDDEEGEDEDDFEAMVAKSAERSTKQRQRGPVRTAWDGVFGGSDDDFEKWLAKLPRGRAVKTDTKTTTPVNRPGGSKAEAKAEAKVVKRPGSKVAEAQTPKPTKRQGGARSETKPAKAVKRPGGAAPKRLSKAAKELVELLRDTENGNTATAEAIANALERGDYDLKTAEARAVEAGINLDD